VFRPAPCREKTLDSAQDLDDTFADDLVAGSGDPHHPLGTLRRPKRRNVAPQVLRNCSTAEFCTPLTSGENHPFSV
jgi:hypothetical protein